MATESLPRIVRHLRRLVGQGNGGTDSDRQLLERFAARKDQDAFAALLDRHGAMVWGVCQRILRHTEDAHDAFQATFLVLARKASSVCWHESIGGWLHAVARRVAWKARSVAAHDAASVQRQTGEADTMSADADPLADVVQRELRALLDEELTCLPEKYRAPLVLCYLEGRTNEEAAAQLGWTKGTVSGRLARARDLLRRRLANRGLAISAGAMMAALSGTTAAAAAPVALVETTLRAALLDSAAAAALGFVSKRAVLLVEGILRSMYLRKLKSVMLFTALGLFAAAAMLLAYQAFAADPNRGQPVPVVEQPEAAPIRSLAPGEFVRMEATLHLGHDGVVGEQRQDLTLATNDRSTVSRFLSCFPGMTADATPQTVGNWQPRITARFLDGIGREVIVHSTWTEWRQGAEHRIVKGNLLKHAGELFAVTRLIDHGTFMDPWQVVGFEEGGKKRAVTNGQLTVTDTRFSYRAMTHVRVGIQFEGRIEYQSPRFYRIDPSKTPREFDFHAGPANSRADQLGIYAIDGDTLTICLDKSGLKRPTEFKTQPGNTQQILMILKRSAPSAEAP